jgi:hypothetical protein
VLSNSSEISEEDIVENKPIAAGRVVSLCINGKPAETITFLLDGPEGDTHRGFSRALSGHDGGYIRTSGLQKGGMVFNWRSWTGLSLEEVGQVEAALGVSIPEGCLLENIVVEGIPTFSLLPPATRLVFPARAGAVSRRQAILAVWEENGPCSGVGSRLAQHYSRPELNSRFVAAARQKRGVTGFVLAAGTVRRGDEVLVYPHE